jgi:hypothetical protein
MPREEIRRRPAGRRGIEGTARGYDLRTTSRLHAGRDTGAEETAEVGVYLSVT